MSELKIKTAAEYRDAAKPDLTIHDIAIQFINDVVTPKIEDTIANPKNYTMNPCTGLSFRIPTDPRATKRGYDAKFDCNLVNAMITLLKPLGYTVTLTHGGGAMWAEVYVKWSVAK